MLAGDHVGVGHARHRDVGVALAPAVAGRRHAHQPRVLAVLHVAGEDAVLDQHGAAGRRALVVDRERAAALRQRAVVDHGDAFRRDALAHQAGEGRGLLAVEVAFETVADRLVQHHARPAGAEHDVHLAGRRRHGLEIDQRLAHRLVDRVLPFGLVEERVEAFAPAIAVAADLLAVAVAHHHRDVDAHQRTHVAISVAVGAQDFDHLPRRAEARPSPAARADPWRAHRRRSSPGASPWSRRWARRADSRRHRDCTLVRTGAAAYWPV